MILKKIIMPKGKDKYYKENFYKEIHKIYKEKVLSIEEKKENRLNEMYKSEDFQRILNRIEMSARLGNCGLNLSNIMHEPYRENIGSYCTILMDMGFNISRRFDSWYIRWNDDVVE